MDRNTPRQLLTLVLRGIGFAALALVIAMIAVARGVWEESDGVAKAWMRQNDIAGMDGPIEGPMYWSVRIVALLMILASLTVLALVWTWFVELVFRWFVAWAFRM